MSAGPYEAFARALRTPFNGPKNQALWGALAKIIGDNTIVDARSALTERLPALASALANSVTANDRQLLQGPGEADVDFATRLVAAPTQWRLAGTPLGLLVQLQFSGFTGALLLQENGLGWYISDTPNLDDLAFDRLVANGLPAWCTRVTAANANPAIPASTDGKAAIPAGTVPWYPLTSGPMDAAGNQWCSRFAVVFPTGSGVDLTVAANLARLRALIALWKPAKALCVGIYVTTAGFVWDWVPGRAWNHAAGLSWDQGTSAYYSA